MNRGRFVAQELSAARFASEIEFLPRAKASGPGKFTYFDSSQPWADNVLPTHLSVPKVRTECVLLKRRCDEDTQWADHTTVDTTTVRYYATLRLDAPEARHFRRLLEPSLHTLVRRTQATPQCPAPTCLPYPVATAVGRGVVPRLTLPLRCQSVDGAVHRGSLWFSSAGSTTAIHYDHEHNMFVQLSGRKRFTLVSPKHHNKLHLHPSLHPSWRQCTWRATVRRRANTWPGNSDIMRYFRVGHCVLCSPSRAPTSPRQPVLSGVR